MWKLINLQWKTRPIPATDSKYALSIHLLCMYILLTCAHLVFTGKVKLWEDTAIKALLDEGCAAVSLLM